MTGPQPGDWFVTSDGPIQASLTGSVYANVIQWATDSTFNHAGICVAPGWVVEAAPGGARRAPIGGYLGSNTVWSGGYGIASDSEREAVAAAAYGLLGTPYSWPDIVAIAMAQHKLNKLHRIDALVPIGKQPWWVKRMADPGELICSPLVDYSFYLCGIHLYDDGRPFQFVTPGDLGRLLAV